MSEKVANKNLHQAKIDEFNFGYPYVNGSRIYARILIKNKKL